jgi:hypothetical protein
MWQVATYECIFIFLGKYFVMEYKGSKHVTRSQKGHQILYIINQNQTFIFLLPFKTIVVVAS